MDRLKIELLPALEGDCILLSYEASGERHNILVDGGRAGTASRIVEYFQRPPANRRVIDLLVVTHVDRDHIEGILRLLDDPDCPQINEVWFNGYRHLSGADNERGARQGEALSRLIEKRGIPWNVRFGGAAVSVGAEGPPRVRLDGGLQLTILSPDRAKLGKLEPRWVAECRKAGLLPDGEDERSRVSGRRQPPTHIDIDELASRSFHPDDSVPNGSSIALLAEIGGRQILLAADAHEDRIVRSLRTVRAGGPRIPLDLVKVSHHGSSANISEALFEEIDCSRYVISSDGSYHGLPDAEAVARIIRFSGPPNEIMFNYRTPFTSPWQECSERSRDNFKVSFGCDGWLKIDL